MPDTKIVASRTSFKCFIVARITGNDGFNDVFFGQNLKAYERSNADLNFIALFFPVKFSDLVFRLLSNSQRST